MKYGDGLVFVTNDELTTEVWINSDYIGMIELTLDAFLELRRLLDDVDGVAVLTAAEGKNVSEAIAADSK